MHETEQRLIAAGRRLAEGGLVTGTSGNLSMRAGENILTTASGTNLGALTEADLTLVTTQGKVVAGTRAPTSELPLHLAIYKSYPETHAVAHAHSPASIAVGLTHSELPPIHYLTTRLGGVVRVADYATFGSPELAETVTKALTNRAAALMRNHGSVAHAHSIEKACEHLELTEWLSDVYARAAALGTPALLTPEQLTAADETFTRLNYGAT